jgi:beta-glucuronidase
MVISEFGAGAAAGVDGKTRYPIGAVSKTFTYDYQEDHHRTTLEQVIERDYICGTMPWIFADFRDDKRPDNPIKDFNLKGILTYDRKKKKAFYVFAKTYEELEEKYGP